MARRDKLQGSLDLLVLRTLRHEPLHGYGITSRIAVWSEGGLEVEEVRSTLPSIGSNATIY